MQEVDERKQRLTTLEEYLLDLKRAYVMPNPDENRCYIILVNGQPINFTLDQNGRTTGGIHQTPPHLAQRFHHLKAQSLVKKIKTVKRTGERKMVVSFRHYRMEIRNQMLKVEMTIENMKGDLKR